MPFVENSSKKCAASFLAVVYRRIPAINQAGTRKNLDNRAEIVIPFTRTKESMAPRLLFTAVKTNQ
jgi:hypothetical protein